MNWKLKRQLIAVGIIGVFVAIVVFSLFFWFKTPSEQTGPSTLLGAQKPIRLLWSRFFLVRQGVYDVAALLENPNDRAKAAVVPYVFRLFDENDILIAAKEGIGFVNPSERFVIVEPLIATGVRMPKRVSFEIRNVVWEAGEKIVSPIIIKEKRFETSETDTTIYVTLSNTNVRSSAPLEAVSVLADAEGNTTAVARADVDPLLAGEEREVVFTWPRVLSKPAVIQVYVRLSPSL